MDQTRCFFPEARIAGCDPDRRVGLDGGRRVLPFVLEAQRSARRTQLALSEGADGTPVGVEGETVPGRCGGCRREQVAQQVDELAERQRRTSAQPLLALIRLTQQAQDGASESRPMPSCLGQWTVEEADDGQCGVAGVAVELLQLLSGGICRVGLQEPVDGVGRDVDQRGLL